MPPYENVDDDMIGLFGHFVLDDDDDGGGGGDDIEPSDNNIPIPLTGVRVDAEVVDFIAEVKISQCYQNNDQTKAIDATFYFPIDHNSSVCSFEAHYDDGKIVKGIIKEKGEARDEYVQAKAQGKQANLLESSKQRDILSLKVGNLGPGQYVKIVISYVTMLKAEQQGSGDFATAFILPTYIAPRYTPVNHHQTGNGDVVDLPSSNTKLFGLNIRGKFKCSSNIKSITCPTHGSDGYTSQIQDKTGTVAFDDIAMDRDLVLLVSQEVPHQPRACVEVSEEGSLAGLVTLFPQIEFQDMAREFIFLVDRSGSMGSWGYGPNNGGKSQIQQASEALMLFLRALPPSCFFNIVGFGSSFAPLFDSPRKYDDYSLEQATDYASNMRADMGGTEIAAPLKHVLSDNSKFNKKYDGKAVERQVFVLTDGQVTNNKQVFDIIQKYCTAAADCGDSKCRVFTLGLGSGASRHLVEGMARAGRGTARFVEGGDADSLRTKVLEQLKQAIQPALDNVSIEWNFPPKLTAPIASDTAKPTSPPVVKTLLGYRSPSANKAPDPIGPALRMYPSIPPPVFNNETFLSFALFDAKVIPESVTIKCDSPDGPLEVSIPVTTEENVFQGSIAHKMAARAAIAEFEDHNKCFRYGSKHEALQLALKFGLVSEQTSFIAVLENPVVEPGTEALEQIIPQHQPTRKAVVHPPDAGGHFRCMIPGSATGGHFRGGSMPSNNAAEKGCSLAHTSDQLDGQASVFMKKSIDLRKQRSLTGRLSGLFEYCKSALPSPPPKLERRGGASRSMSGTSVSQGYVMPEQPDDNNPSLDWNRNRPAPGTGEPTPPKVGDILEQQNNERIDILSDQVSRLKGLTVDIGNEVREQNSCLDDMGDGYANERGTSSKNSQKSAAAAGSLTARDPLLELCLLQKAEGFFLLDNNLAHALGLSLVELNRMADTATGNAHRDDPIVSATIIAVAAMRSQYATNKAMWELQEDKALKFLALRGVANVDSLIAKFECLLTKK